MDTLEIAQGGGALGLVEGEIVCYPAPKMLRYLAGITAEGFGGFSDKPAPRS